MNGRPFEPFVHQCPDELTIGTDRYRQCTSCGMVLVNIDGLHEPDIAQLLADYTPRLW